ncbi:MAG TPA: PIN domain-containing protein [Thermomicrobiales bacterium]|nr:PIN domain-containing protein [Thermomicrobiales bacterium]
MANLVRAVLDANVLIRAGARDTLLRAAEHDLYRPYWSETILQEVERNLVRHHLTTRTQAQRLLNVLREVFPEALAVGYEWLIIDMPIQAKDRHVLAAAVSAGADVIVTDNLRDFPASSLEPYGVEAQSLDAFLMELFAQNPEQMMQILTEQGADLNPPRDRSEVIRSLTPHTPGFVADVIARPLES